MDIDRIARVTRAKRLQMGLTQVELGERIGMSDAWISRIELKVFASIKVDDLRKLAAGLELPVESLTGEESRAMAEVLAEYGIDEDTRLHVQEISTGLPVAAPKLARYAKEQIRLLAELLRPNGDQGRATASGQ